MYFASVSKWKLWSFVVPQLGGIWCMNIPQKKRTPFCIVHVHAINQNKMFHGLLNNLSVFDQMYNSIIC